VKRRRGVFIALDAHLVGRDFDALSDDEAQQWVAALITKKRDAVTVMKIYVAALKALGRWAVKQRLSYESGGYVRQRGAAPGQAGVSRCLRQSRCRWPCCSDAQGFPWMW
jgi:hypothetical protein